MELDTLAPYLKEKTFDTFKKTEEYSAAICEKAQKVLDEYFDRNKLDKSDICVICTGSIGRFEALQGSDLDVIPIIKSKATFDKFNDSELRETLKENLNIKVSKGENLTKYILLDDLVDPASIGGGKDDSAALTKRILTLTEGRSIGGDLPWQEIAERVFDAYAKAEKTSGRYANSFFNDLSRYYRTLLIEYKAKVDVEDKGWCLRNLKLRHSRKIWYFSTLLTVIKYSNQYPNGGEAFKQDLLQKFKMSPIKRLSEVAGPSHRESVSRILERFSYFLSRLASDGCRDSLENLPHESRDGDENYFYRSLKLNSDLIHNEMYLLVESMEPYIRRRIFDWFVL